MNRELKIIRRVPYEKRGIKVEVECYCGEKFICFKSCIKTGHTTSCGCYRRQQRTKHGMIHTAEYKIYHGMIARCYNENNPAYKNYGGRGILLSDDWKESFENFYRDMGKRPEWLSIERIDNDKGYSKENCKRATREEQNKNRRIRKSRRIYKGKFLSKRVEELGLNYNTVNHRLYTKRMSIKDALGL